MRTLIVALVVGLLVVAGAPRANAITAGTADGSGHPEVGLMAAFDADGGYLWRCSGTLISDRVFLTAGHCTQSPAARVDLWFTPTVGGLSDVHGTPRTYPAFDPATPSTDDVGVVVLDRPMPLTTYGRLPTAGQLDTLHPGPSTAFTAVGYGLQAAYPDAAARKDQQAVVRMVAHPHLVQIDSGLSYVANGSMLLSANASSGGTCFGDSGGPNFLGDSNVIAGTTSFMRNPTCAGTTGAQRLDRADLLGWIASVEASPTP